MYWRQSSRDSHWVVDDLHLGHLVQAVAEDSGELLVLVGAVRVEDREAVEVVEGPEKASELRSCPEGGGACQAEETAAGGVSELSLENFGGIFLVLLIGLLIGGLLALLEKYWIFCRKESFSI